MKSSLFPRELSVLGFGSAALMGRVGRRESLAALGAALDVGINVFDTARSYGYGESEALLGEFLAGSRTQVFISSKFGIVAARQTRWKQAAKPVLRAALGVLPGLAKAIRSQVASQLHPGQFTVATLHESIATSLKKLRTDYLDFLFMHEASSEAIHNQELLRALEDLVRAGKVRVIGVSAELPIAAEALQIPAVGAIQFACHAGNGFAGFLRESAVSKPVLRFANHPFGGVQGVATIQAKLKDPSFAQDFPPALREKLLHGDRPSLLADVILNCALAGNDVVLAGMMKPPHLRGNALAVSQSRFEPDEVIQLRSWFAEHPGMPA